MTAGTLILRGFSLRIECHSICFSVQPSFRLPRSSRGARRGMGVVPTAIPKTPNSSVSIREQTSLTHLPVRAIFHYSDASGYETFIRN